MLLPSYGSQEIELEAGINRQTCPSCKIARIRPIDISRSHLRFDCGNPRCKWKGYALLPEIKKKLIYLDTSTVVSISRALATPEKNSPWISLYKSLIKAVKQHVICCPQSPVVTAEAELGNTVQEVIKVAQSFGYTNFESELQIRQQQAWRAYEKWQSKTTPKLETAPPEEDAFKVTPHRWLPMFEIRVSKKSNKELVESHRAEKTRSIQAFEYYVKKYLKHDMKYDEIRNAEATGVGQAYISEFQQQASAILNPSTQMNSLEMAASLMPGFFASLLHEIHYRHKTSEEEALEKAYNFCTSKHLAMTPFADISSRLFAGLAMHAKGKSPRVPRESDYDDITHVATYLPYVDVFICDKFFGELCNQSHIQLSKTYNTDIRSLTPKTIPEFITYIESLVSESPHSDLSKRIANCIAEGGYHHEQEQRFRNYLNRNDEINKRKPS